MSTSELTKEVEEIVKSVRTLAELVSKLPKTDEIAKAKAVLERWIESMGAVAAVLSGAPLVRCWRKLPGSDLFVCHIPEEYGALYAVRSIYVTVEGGKTIDEVCNALRAKLVEEFPKILNAMVEDVANVLTFLSDALSMVVALRNDVEGLRKRIRRIEANLEAHRAAQTAQ